MAVAACAAHGLSISDYEPTTIVTLWEQAGQMQCWLLYGTAPAQRQRLNWALDTSDALAVAVCHLTVRRFVPHWRGK